MSDNALYAIAIVLICLTAIVVSFIWAAVIVGRRDDGR